MVAQTVRGIEDVGGRVEVDRETDLLSVNQEFTASIVISRCFERPTGVLRWKLRLDTGLRPDISIAVRMRRSNVEPLDYYVLPRLDLRNRPISYRQLCNGWIAGAKPEYGRDCRGTFSTASTVSLLWRLL